MEAAQFGAPVITGPYTQNFRDIMRAFTSENAVVVAEAQGFSSALLELIRDEAKRREIGARGASVVKTNAGATERTLAMLKGLLHERVSA